MCKSLLVLVHGKSKAGHDQRSKKKYEARKTTIIECEISVWMSLRDENSFVCGLIVSAGKLYSRLDFFSRTRHLSFVVAARKPVKLEIEILLPFFRFVFTLETEISGFTRTKKWEAGWCSWRSKVSHDLLWQSFLSQLFLVFDPLLFLVIFLLNFVCFVHQSPESITFPFNTFLDRRLSNACTTSLPVLPVSAFALNLGSFPNRWWATMRDNETGSFDYSRARWFSFNVNSTPAHM